MNWLSSQEVYTRSTILAKCETWSVNQNVDYLSLMDEFGIPRQALYDRNLFISHERLGQLLEKVAQVSGDANICLRHALTLAPDFPNFGALIHVARFSVSLRDWISQASRLAYLQTNAWTPHLEEREDGLASFLLVEGPVRRMPRQLCEATLGTMFMLVRELVQDRKSTARRVCFRHEAPADLRLHQEIFQCDLHFGCRHNGFLFDVHHLDVPIVGQLAKFRYIFDIYIRAQIRNLVTRDIFLRTAVYATIKNLTGTQLCTAERVAELLGMSEKKMQRLLRAEGTSFRAEALAARKALAVEMLTKTVLPINEIANILGYGSSTAFALAFSKITGRTPSDFRASMV